MPTTACRLLLACLLFLAIAANGQPTRHVFDQMQPEWELNGSLQVLQLPNDALGLEDVSGVAWSPKFVPYPDFIKGQQPANTAGNVPLDPEKVYWWRISLQNKLGRPIENWVLYTGRSNFTEVFVLDANGRTLRQQITGPLVPAKQKDFRHGNRQAERIALSLPVDSTVTLYGKVKVVNHKRPHLRLVLAQRDFFQSWEYVRKSRLDWGFIGFLLSYVLLNLLLFFSTRDQVFFWHSLFQTGILIYLMEFFNIMPDIAFMRDHPHLIQVLIYASLCLMDVSCVQFVRYFMVMKKSRPDWDHRLKQYAWVRVAIAVGLTAWYFATTNARYIDIATSLLLIVQYAALIGLLLHLFGRDDRRGIFLIGGTAFFVTGVVLNAVYVMKGIGLQFGFSQIGVIGEVALFTLGIGFRMKILHKEKRKALVFKDLDEFKSKFYTNITHEFRTPLTVILGMAEQLQHEAQHSPPGQKDKLELIRRNGKQLLGLINRLLDLSKAQSGTMALDMRLGNVADYLRYLTDSLHSYAASKDIRLRYVSHLDQFEMDFDAEKLQDVMTNLLSNAIKFTPPGGEVRVTVNEVPGNCIAVEVQDNGAGIPAAMLPKIFERFFTAKDVGNAAGGSGIGLALTKELVELMGGSIAVQSREGEGATFTVTLPVSRKAERSELPPVPFKPMDMQPKAAEPRTLPQHFQFHSEDNEKPICLVIDDSPDIVRYLEMVLESEYLVAVAYNGKRGIEKALELLPDVIVSDVMMPEKDGLEVLDALKNDERTSHIPIILLTAKATVADRLEGLRRGADAYLQKPFDREELFIELRRTVELRHRLISYFSKMPNLPSGEPAPELDIQIEDAFLNKAREAVEKNLHDEDFDIHRLCRALTMSRAQIHRKLTALTGLSATHFIRSIRLQRAKGLLETTRLTVSEVAYEVGFRDPNYFSMTFSEEFGFSPSETRK